MFFEYHFAAASISNSFSPGTLFSRSFLVYVKLSMSNYQTVYVRQEMQLFKLVPYWMLWTKSEQVPDESRQNDIYHDDRTYIGYRPKRGLYSFIEHQTYHQS